MHPNTALAQWSERPGILALSMERALTSRLFSALAPLLGDGRTLYCIDGWNRFDPYALAQWARARALPVTDLLDRVFVTRCFTIHQFHGAIEELLPPLRAQSPRPAVLVLGAEYLFLEESLPLGERRVVLRSAMGLLRRQADAGLAIAIAYETRGLAEHQRAWWPPLIRSVADHRAAITDPSSRSAAERRRAAREPMLLHRR